MSRELRDPVPGKGSLAVGYLWRHSPVEGVSATVAVRASGAASNPASNDLEFTVGGGLTVKRDTELAGAASMRSTSLPGDGVRLSDFDVVLLADLEGVGPQLAGKVGLCCSGCSIDEWRVVKGILGVGNRLLHDQMSVGQGQKSGERKGAGNLGVGHAVRSDGLVVSVDTLVPKGS